MPNASTRWVPLRWPVRRCVVRNVARTPADIVARIKDAAASGDDVFGFRHEALVSALDFDHAQPYLQETLTPADWTDEEALDLVEMATNYFNFALQKILSHRGISSIRSVGKLREYAWLMGRDDAVAAMDAAPYEQYGAPKVKGVGVALGYPWPAGDARLERMAAGQECRAGCRDGCGR